MDERARDAHAAELLAHASWIRRLARSLLADAAAADDVVQETMLVALRGERRATSSWLAEVALNLARERWRSERGRREREARAARPEAQPDASAPLERLERQRELVEAVRALDEPYRTTVLLRYMEGLSCARIARREGVPAATVRSRLQRGLAELRRRLGGGDAEERRVFALGLLSLSTGERATTWMGGAIAMQAGTKLGIVAAVAAVASVGVWVGLRDDRETPVAPPESALEGSRSEPAVEESRSAPGSAGSDNPPARVAAEPRTDPAEKPPGRPLLTAKLEAAREDLLRAAEATLEGALDPGALVEAALLALQLDVADRPLPEPRGRALRYPLLGTPEGLSAELLVQAIDHAERASPVLSLSLRVEPPVEPYVIQGSPRQDAEVRLSVLRDVEGEPASLSLRTTFEPAVDPNDRLAHLRSGTFMRGLHASIDVQQASEWTARAEGLRMTSGTPERGSFDSASWEVPITLVGEAWAGPRAVEQVEALNAALISKHAAIQADD